jgi:hypothetical protein
VSALALPAPGHPAFTEKQMFDSLFAFATGKVVLVALAVLFISSFVLNYVNPKNRIKDDLGDDYVATDSTFRYDTAKVIKMLGRYSPDDYEAHESFILRYDLIYPLCYGIPSLLLLAYFCPWRGGGPRWLVLLPLATMAFDYAENFTMLVFLRRFRANPQTPLTLLEVSRAFTNAKLCAIVLSFILLLFFIAWGLLARPRVPSPS